MNDSSKYAVSSKEVPFNHVFLSDDVLWVILLKNPNFPAVMHWNPPMEGNSPILRTTLVVKLQYLLYFPNNFQADYTGES
jgi:hypothetical protein